MNLNSEVQRSCRKAVKYMDVLHRQRKSAVKPTLKANEMSQKVGGVFFLTCRALAVDSIMPLLFDNTKVKRCLECHLDDMQKDGLVTSYGFQNEIY